MAHRHSKFLSAKLEIYRYGTSVFGSTYQAPVLTAGRLFARGAYALQQVVLDDPVRTALIIDFDN